MGQAAARNEVRGYPGNGSLKAGPLSADKDLCSGLLKRKKETPTILSPLSSSQEGSLGWLWTGRKGSRYVGWLLASPQTPAPSVGGRADTAAPAGWGGGGVESQAKL